MIVGFVGVEFVVIHVMVNASILTKFAYSLKIGSLQLHLHQSGFGPQPKEWHVRDDMGNQAALVFFPRCPM